MADSTPDSDAILRSARASLDDNRQGGRRVGGQPIGEGSARLRRRNLVSRLKLIGIAVLGILLAAMAAGIVLNGIGFVGVMLTALALLVAVLVFSNFPKVKVPRRADLTRTSDARQLVARTELWLEHQRPALPAPAVTLVDRIGVQLDALGLQLETIDPAHPAAAETRKLVGEHLPETVDAWRRVPASLRREDHAGATADARLTESLGRISEELDRVTRQLADGALDDLAVRTRYLEYKYSGGAASDGPPPIALPTEKH
ncbi:hypothetical protein [Croceibacterium mercuriale]|uniref:hypothetical protein n=1 Tax=Croceibacterium mercuriale TaxID=1572751 RepID=UPI00068D74CC|nr:hypothetical protein [Croceibacterium mercuriale]